MRDELAERALTEIIGRGSGVLNEEVAELQALAQVKYDAYGMFRPGVKFLESLAGWLMQFDPSDRQDALEFVREKLLFVSFPELDHLVQLAYPDVIRPWLIERVTRAKGLSRYAISTAVGDQMFREIERRTLVLGLSDGARLDQLRRSATTLSTEQFHLTYLIEENVMAERREALEKALNRQGSSAGATFSQLVLVDDFAGSGTTMLKKKEVGWGGKLQRLKELLEGETAEFFSDDLEVLVVLYIASAQARDHLDGLMPEAGLGNWRVKVILQLRDQIRVSASEPAVAALCEKYYDPLLDDEHTGRVPLGFGGCDLPLVLHHNTPNNSISLLWGDTFGRDDAKPMRALFPRYARHHQDRP